MMTSMTQPSIAPRSIGRLALLIVLAACGVHPTPSTTADPSAAGPARLDRNMITKAMLTGQRFTTAFEAVEALRSNWLHPPGPDSFQNPTEVRVYLDNVALGNVETLKTLNIQDIQYVRF